jgi:hypothetical protein
VVAVTPVKHLTGATLTDDFSAAPQASGYAYQCAVPLLEFSPRRGRLFSRFPTNGATRWATGSASEMPIVDSRISTPPSRDSGHTAPRDGRVVIGPAGTRWPCANAGGPPPPDRGRVLRAKETELRGESFVAEGRPGPLIPRARADVVAEGYSLDGGLDASDRSGGTASWARPG